MTLNELLVSGGSILLILTIVQIAPITINPWSKLARGIGSALNADVLERLEETKADTARYRVIRFDDEIRHKQKHTEEHFNQILDDIDKYEKHCGGHPDYKNSKAESAIRNVKQTYERCREENSFLV